MEPGKSISEWKIVRIYVKMTECSTAGEKLKKMRAKIAAHAGEAAAKMIHAAITFEVQEIRPLADFGQGWEKSILIRLVGEKGFRLPRAGLKDRPKWSSS
jgi:hypothetical protein